MRDLRKRPMPTTSKNIALAIKKYTFIGSGMNGTGTLGNCSAGHVVNMRSRPIDCNTIKPAKGRTLVLNAFSGVDVLNSSNYPSNYFCFLTVQVIRSFRFCFLFLLPPFAWHDPTKDQCFKNHSEFVEERIF